MLFIFFMYYRNWGLYSFVTTFLHYYGGGSHKDNFDESHRVLSACWSLYLLPTAERGVDWVSLPFYLCLYLYYAFTLILMFINEIFYCGTGMI
jgi:hypothetical protein